MRIRRAGAIWYWLKMISAYPYKVIVFSSEMDCSMASITCMV
jgi:hypothetical protein